MALTAAVTLLYLENAIFFDQRVDSYHGSDSYGAGVLQFYFLDCSSDRKSMSHMTDYQKIGYFSQQLRTYDIKRLQIENFSVDFDIFPTAATIGSMFNTLAEKTGEDLFHYTDTGTSRPGENYSDIDSAAVAIPAAAAFLSISTDGNVCFPLEETV